MGCGKYESRKESLESRRHAHMQRHMHTHTHTHTPHSCICNLRLPSDFFLLIKKLFYFLQKPKSRVEVIKLSGPVQIIFPLNHNFTKTSSLSYIKYKADCKECPTSYFTLSQTAYVYLCSVFAPWKEIFLSKAKPEMREALEAGFLVGTHLWAEKPKIDPG